ncbi:MAG: hypothetical protein FWD14_04095 [Treponema sp.]|nr:hypothetical protein [Treponema sp.]
MLIKKSCLIILFFLVYSQIFAGGRAEESESDRKVHNNEWILCLTEINSSSLPLDKINISDLIQRKMTEKIVMISYRTRISHEYAFYEGYMWAQERSAAAKALEAKMNERSQFLYRGEANWQYRRNIKRIDSEIEKLRTALEDVEGSAPLINKEPEFNLTQENLNFTFPSAPAAGQENRFSSVQGADAFLVSSLSDFHGRYFLSVKLYTVYTRSFVWQDSILFSHEELESALDEIIRRLMVVLSGSRPAAVAITTEPEDTLVLINRSFAGRSGTEVLEYPPGTITITASALNHDSLTFDTVLAPGELANIKINLNPVEYGEISILGNTGSRVYHGALYVGEIPLTLRLPINHLEYIEIETPDNKRGTIAFQTPGSAEYSQSISLRTSVPLQRGRVDRERRGFYWAWGGIWISGIAAWLAYYNLMSIDFAINYHYLNTGTFSQKFYNDHGNMYNILNGTLMAVGVISVYGVYRFVRYLYTANKGATPSIAPGRR